jgi:N-acetylglucosamine malate deacetylase 1
MCENLPRRVIRNVNAQERYSMETTRKFGCDLLVVSPHTDDAEIGLGGTLARLNDRGAGTWVVDLTRGELGSNATVQERWIEAERASEILGLTGRAQLELPDGFIDAGDPQQVGGVVSVLRALRPRWVVTAPDPVRHPDHQETPRLVAKACFMAHLASLQPDSPKMQLWANGAPWPGAMDPWRIEALFSVCPSTETPSVFFDISESWERKTAALACYASQFFPGDGRKPTAINNDDFLPRMERRARNWGRRAGCLYAEALRTESAAVLDGMPTQRWSK